MLLSISAFALALVAVGFAVRAWLTSLINGRATESWRVRTDERFTKLSENVERTLYALQQERQKLAESSPQRLAARVDDLSEAVQALGDTHRRFAGRVWQRIGRNADPQGQLEVDGPPSDELSALVAFQSAPPAKPNGNG